MALPSYIISKAADPIFGVLIGIGATVARIRREECLEKGRTGKEVLAMLESALQQWCNPSKRIITQGFAVCDAIDSTCLIDLLPLQLDLSYLGNSTSFVRRLTPIQRKRQPSPNKFLTPGDDVATRLFGMESRTRSNGFIGPIQGNGPGGSGDDEGEALLNTASLVGEILEDLAEEEGREGDNTIMENSLEELDENEEEEEEERAEEGKDHTEEDEEEI
ncbi:hypothetical protein L211DRAFT_850901 [Terfezia boudieri ATCC MYA-4762]|uniref:Uncharacterized protein n=1 Tax=Terfezia boudieri ATCC MYA-4762 TaxID=1051890 RepID=A0A3N4LK85_9PEZI|nr:hypothetical protein L211DRAFT_850901 [Terfezia boudieri ATCC MYA-4762]